MIKFARCSAVALALCAFLVPTSSLAQHPLHGKWKITPPKFYIVTNTHIDCDAPTRRAAATWSNAGANFSFVDGGLRTQKVSEFDPRDISIEAGAVYQDAVGQAERAPYEEWYVDGSVSRWYVLDADITVNENMMFNEKVFHCGSANTEPYKYDYESLVLHELGHVLGINDNSSDAAARCAMYYNLGNGITRRTLCADDVNAAIHFYGRK